MRGIRPKNYQNKERCFALAKSCKTKKEFVNGNNGALAASRNNGCLDEICKENNWSNDSFGSNKTQSWLRPATRKDVWCFADEYYETWIENEKCGYAKLREVTNIRLDRMHRKFERGWIPSEDKEWREWAEEIKMRIRN